MRSDRLFSRDFTLMVAGQIISLFGNAILRFALSLYVLDTTGSAAAFGGILAVSMVPTILCSPLGGVLADRVPRQRIMWGLDFFTAALVLGYGLFFASRGTVLAVGVLMVLLQPFRPSTSPRCRPAYPPWRRRSTCPPPTAWWPRYRPWPICWAPSWAVCSTAG